MEKLRGRIGQTKVRRHWPGKAPKWAEEVDVLDRSHDDDSGELLAKKNKEPRLHHLSQTRADHQCVKAVSTEEELRNQVNRDEEEDEDSMEERRRRIRDNYLKRVKEDVDLLPIEEEEEEEEEGSESETDSEEEMIGITMFKPIFVPKPERDTVAEREWLEAEEEALEESAKRKLEMRKIETKQIVVEEVKKDEEKLKNKLLEEANIGDLDDEINEAEEYEVWKTREIARRNKREREETDEFRNMTEQEIKNLRHSSSAKPKRKWKFMQRYYHKGAFFQEPGSVGDFSAPTGEDKMDKSKLRKVMQVKNFGRSGRTKWTHLVNEDTTFGKKPELADMEAPIDTTLLYSLHERYNKKMADMDAPIAKPKRSYKMNDFKT